MSEIQHRGGVTAWRRRLLIVGGTDEGCLLARAAEAAFGGRLEIVTALEGRPEGMVPSAGTVRLGGFRQADEMAAYLCDGGFDLCVDAAPPFAAGASQCTAQAAAAAGVPRLRLLRPMWRRHARDRWIEVSDTAGAAGALRSVGRRVYLTLPSGDLPAFGDFGGARMLVRVSAGGGPAATPPDWIALPRRARLELAEERQLLRKHEIDLLVTRAEGGAVSEAKIVAAREADIPVVMIRRPPPPAGDLAGDAGAALGWLRRRVAELDAAAPRTESRPP